MEGAAARPTDALVDGILNQRMSDLVAQPTVRLVLHDQPRSGEPLQRDPKPAGRPAEHPRQAVEVDPSADHREDLKQLSVCWVEAAHEQGNPAGEALRNPGEPRLSEVGALLDQRPQQSDDEQRISPGPFDQPGHQRTGHIVGSQHGAGQRRHRLVGQRLQPEPGEDIVLLEPNQHLAGDRMPCEIGRPRGGQDKHPAVRKPAGHVVERLPRRHIGVVDVVEDDDHRAAGADVVEQLRQRSKQPFGIRLADRLVIGFTVRPARCTAQRPPSRQKHQREVAYRRPAQPAHHGSGRRAEQPLERLDPKSQRICHPQLEGPRADDDRRVALPFGELVDQTGLADARLASHQHDAERTRADQGQLLIQRSDLGVPSDKGRPKRNANQMA